MRSRHAAALIAAFAALEGVSAGAAQRPASCPVTCVNDWRKAGLGEPGLERLGARIAPQCSDASRIDWDGLIADAEQALRENPQRTPVTPKIEAWLRMARQEKQHVAAARNTPCGLQPSASGTTATPRPENSRAGASAPSAVAGDSDARLLPLDTAFQAVPAQLNRFTVEPRFRSWVPDYIRRKAAERLTKPIRIAEVVGPVTIRRGDKVLPLPDVLRRGNDLVLRSGDIFETGPRGRLVLEDDGHLIELGENDAVGAGLAGNCLQVYDSRRTEVVGWHLIEGTLQWATTTNRVRARCAFSSLTFLGSIRGTEFTVTSQVSESENILSITVTSGAVDITSPTGATEAITAGQSRTLKATLAALQTPAGCAERVKVTTEIASLEQQIAASRAASNPLLERVSTLSVGELLDLQNRTIQLGDLLGRLSTARQRLIALPPCDAAPPARGRS